MSVKKYPRNKYLPRKAARRLIDIANVVRHADFASMNVFRRFVINFEFGAIIPFNAGRKIRIQNENARGCAGIYQHGSRSRNAFNRVTVFEFQILRFGNNQSPRFAAGMRMNL